MSYGIRPYLYIIRAGRFYKIGYSLNPAKRLIDIQVGNPLKCELLTSMEFPHTVTEIELELHKKYSQKRTFGEWFVLTKVDLKDIHKFLRKSKKNDPS